MKRNWVLMVMAAALAAAPAAAQPPQTQPPATAAQPAQPQKSATSADEHLRAAAAALNDVQAANLSARAKTQVNELKRRLTALERAGASSSTAAAAGQAKPTAKAAAAGVNWGTDVAAMDKVLTSLLGAEAAATGTTGTTPKAAGTAGSKAAAAVTLDETSRAKLIEFRTHLTAYAAAMGGGTSSAPTATATDPAATANVPAGTTPAATQPPAGSTTSAPATSTTSTPQTSASSAAPAAAGQPDMDAAKRHLAEARNSLSGLTQLPAAAQLAGESRTQVSQLITNFNELITTQSNWRDSYAKVNANMTALLGADTAAVAAATGTAGAVGTSGSSGITLDPTVREKLTEMRKHLAEFEKAASGGVTTTATPTANVEDPPTSAPNTPPTATGTTGTTAAAPTTDAQRTAQADWMRHVTAIEAMLKAQDESGGLTLDKAKVEMLRTHLAEIKKLLGGSK